jgi:acyl dehydratase
MNSLSTGDRFVLTINGVTQEQINAFGALLGTNGKIHTDPDWAACSPAQGVVVQGGLVLASLNEAMTHIVGEDRWLRGGELEIKFVSLVRPHQPVTLEIDVERVSAQAAEFALAWSTQAGTKVLVGSAAAIF